MASTNQIELPPKYYLDNFWNLLHFVQKMYENILEEREWDFINRFEALPEDGQCLFLRMMNRRKRFFRIDSFDYSELTITDELWLKLIDQDFASPAKESSEDYYLELLSLYTKPELITCAKVITDYSKGLNKLKKPELLAWYLENIPYADFLIWMDDRENVLRQGYEEVSSFLMFLYFGNTYGDMTQFVIRDLGNSKFEDFADEDFTPYFKTRKDADDKFSIASAYHQFRLMRDVAEPETVFEVFSNWLPKRDSISTLAFSTYDRLIKRLGEYFEKQQLFDEALAIYQNSDNPPSRERQVRILNKQKRIDEALMLCKEIENTFKNADEKYFAIDFQNRLNKKRIKSTTAYLKSAPSCQISSSYLYQVEQGVLAHYQAQGWDGFHSENFVWRGLFGLFFWDVLFEQETNSIHNPFQRIPSDLYYPEFFEKREDRFLERIDLLKDPVEAQSLILDNFDQKTGINTPFIYWHPSLIEGIQLYFQQIDSQLIGKTLLEIARNVRENMKGLPDLFVFKDDQYDFIEVKSPNDSLSAQQLHWLHFFEDIGINAGVMRVKWEEE